MAHLISCFECGAMVSSDATSCPKCKSPVHGYTCKICCKKEKKSDLQSYNYEKTDYEGYKTIALGLAHPDCLKAVQEEYKSFQYTCLVCNHTYRPRSQGKCPKCGDPVRVNADTSLCQRCSLPLIDAAAKVVDSYDGIPIKFMHQVCYRSYYNRGASSGCFLATALYGENSSKVKTLCLFRDEYLTRTGLGRSFIALYIRLSPSLARLIAKNSFFRTLTRYCLVSPALFIAKSFISRTEVINTKE